jgi:hypothetical protein
MRQRPWNPLHPALAGPAAAGVAYPGAWLAALVVWPSKLGATASGARVVAAYSGHEAVAIAQYLLAPRGGRRGPGDRRARARPGGARCESGRRPGVGRAAAVAGIAAASVSLCQLVLGLLLSAWAARNGLPVARTCCSRRSTAWTA